LDFIDTVVVTCRPGNLVQTWLPTVSNTTLARWHLGEEVDRLLPSVRGPNGRVRVVGGEIEKHCQLTGACFRWFPAWYKKSTGKALAGMSGVGWPTHGSKENYETRKAPDLTGYGQTLG